MNNHTKLVIASFAALSACSDEYGEQRGRSSLALEPDAAIADCGDAEAHAPDAEEETPPPAPDAGVALDATNPPDAESAPDSGPRLSGCFITGGGHLGPGGAGRSNQDSFGGNAMTMRNGSVRGQWQNTTHQGDRFHGSVDTLICWRDEGAGPEVPRAEPNNAEFTGTGRWNRSGGYTFRVHIADRAEGGSGADEYEIQIWSPSGALVYENGGIIAGGNLQIHPGNAGHP